MKLNSLSFILIVTFCVALACVIGHQLTYLKLIVPRLEAMHGINWNCDLLLYLPFVITSCCITLIIDSPIKIIWAALIGSLTILLYIFINSSLEIKPFFKSMAVESSLHFWIFGTPIITLFLSGVFGLFYFTLKQIKQFK